MTQTLDSQDNKAFVELSQHPEEPRRYMPAEIYVAIIGAGELEHLHEAVTIDKASAILAASILHFGEVSIPEAREHPTEQGIPINMERTWLLNELGN